MGNTSETDIFNEIHKEQQERQNLLDRREKHSKKRKEEQQKQKREQLEESIKNKPYYQFTDQEKEYYIITHRELFSHTSDEKGTLGLFITDSPVVESVLSEFFDMPESATSSALTFDRDLDDDLKDKKADD